MKKKRTALHPGDEMLKQITNENSDLPLKKLLPGNQYRIGPPSGLYYNFIHTIIPQQISMEESENLTKIQGLSVTVRSIIKMINGQRIAVLVLNDDKLFLKKYDKLFAQVEKAIGHGEIITFEE